jgi:hypothetical protein
MLQILAKARQPLGKLDGSVADLPEAPEEVETPEQEPLTNWTSFMSVRPDQIAKTLIFLCDGNVVAASSEETMR